MMSDERLDSEKEASTGGSTAALDVELLDGDDVEQPKTNKSSSTKTKSIWMIALLAALIVLILVVVVPTVYFTKKNQPSSSSSSNSNTEGSDTETETETTTGEKTPNTTNTTSTPTTGGGPFNATNQLPLFNEDILEGYDSPEELSKAFEDAAWFLVEQVVMRNNGVKGYESSGMGRGPTMDNSLESSPVADSTPNSNTAGRGDGSSYGTNNQENNMEEGDLIVSDGQFVYAAYNDYLLIWDATTGTLSSQIRMPEIEMGNTNNQTSSTSSSNGGSSFVAPDQDPYMYYPRPTIMSLLLNEGRLLVILSGYGQGIMAREGITEPALYDFLNTHIRVYDTADLIGQLSSSSSGVSVPPLGTANLQGSFNGVRANNGIVHIMALSGVNTYTDLILPFEKSNAPQTLGQMDADEYTQEAYDIARKEAIPNFVNKLLSELEMGDSGMPKLVKLNLFQNEYSDAGIEGRTFPSGIVNTLALVHSFDMMAASFSVSTSSGGGGSSSSSGTATPTVVSAGSFLPSYWAQFYGSETHLIIAGQGQNVNASTGYTVEATNFLSFRIQSGVAQAVAEAVGSVDGYILNNYAIDVKDDFLRVGVSINNQWFFATEPMPLMMEDGGAADSGGRPEGDEPVSSTPTAENATVPESNTENYIVILTLPGMNGTEAGTMAEVGRLKLGKPNELFTAVRMYDNIAYAVTFERTDPLYVLDLSDPTEPLVVAELNVMGFSSYLHSLNDDNSLLLGIGQSADENGTSTGTKMTVYNVVTPTAPFVAAEYVIENTDTSSTYTAAEWDPKALRVVPSMSIVSLPIDSSNWETGYRFNGFWTFLVNATHIIKECELGHTFNESIYYVDPIPADTGVADGAEDGNSGGGSDGSTGGSDGSAASDPATGTSVASPCFYCAYLPPRSMIFNGNLMTVNNHFVRSHDLSTCTEQWALDIVIQDNSTWYGCCGAYW